MDFNATTAAAAAAAAAATDNARHYRFIIGYLSVLYRMFLIIVVIVFLCCMCHYKVRCRAENVGGQDPLEMSMYCSPAPDDGHLTI